ncbi:MAG: ROK family protein, partial [Oscillospiraceae bacterium]|nr:ROK family protein [Oscillospiraceae bacterium]
MTKEMALHEAAAAYGGGGGSVLAIDVGGSKIIAAIVDGEGAVVDRRDAGLRPDVTASGLTEMIVGMKEGLFGANPGIARGITRAGMTIPGVADMRRGVWVYACFSGIGDFDVAGKLGPRLGLEVHIGNDANLCAYAEMVYGVCRDDPDFIWVTVSNGVGSGVVSGGRLMDGATSCAAELGHIVVEEDGETCPCGNVGCLEAHASGPAIARRYHKGLEAAGRAPAAGAPASAREVAERARMGDAAAAEAYEHAGRCL